MNFKIIILMIFLISFNLINAKIIKNDNISREEENNIVVKLPGAFKHYPITNDYYQSFMSSNTGFIEFLITYRMSAEPEHPNARSQNLSLRSKIAFEGDVYSGEDARWKYFILSEITSVDALYKDIDNNWAHYKIDDFSMEYISPIWQIFQQNPTYFFSGAEYNGEEYFECAMPHDFGHINYISFELDISTPFINNSEPAYKSLVKGWDPGDNPPQDLMPVINYIETVILPIMREHPYPPE